MGIQIQAADQKPVGQVEEIDYGYFRNHRNGLLDGRC